MLCSTCYLAAANGGCCRKCFQSGARSIRTGRSGANRVRECVCLGRQYKNQVGMARKKQGRNACSTLQIVDAQRVKNSDTACQKGYDAAKKVSGIKRHLAVDRQGFTHAVAVTTAEITDRKGALFALQQEQTELRQVQCVQCESGYVATPLSQGVRDILAKHVKVELAKRTEPASFKVMPKRWSVARSMAWWKKHCRLSKNWEHRRYTRVQCMRLAFRTLLLR